MKSQWRVKYNEQKLSILVIHQETEPRHVKSDRFLYLCVCYFLCLPVFIYLFVRLFGCLSISLSVYLNLSIYLSCMREYGYLSPNYLSDQRAY